MLRGSRAEPDMPVTPDKLQRWLNRTLAADPPRSKSLIMTLWGDSIAPVSQGIWLGELISLLTPFGVNERLVRTSAYRLVEEGWLKAERHRRQSWYRLTEPGTKRVEHASERIYAQPQAAWNGEWTFVILRPGGNSAGVRLQLRRELGWEGFGAFTPGTLVHPCADATFIRDILRRLRLLESAFVLRTQQLSEAGASSDAALVQDAWDFAELRGHYEHLVSQFGGMPSMLRSGCPPQTAFVVQTLLVHSYRRAVLRDPRLPKPLLPAGWPGHEAYDLCQQIYRLTAPGTQEFLRQHTTLCTPAPELSRGFLHRFGLPVRRCPG